MKKLASVFLSSTLSLTLLCQQAVFAQTTRDSKYSMAVLNLQSAGTAFSQNEIRQLTDELTFALSRTDKFHIMSQSSMESTLYSKNIDPFNCATQQCAIEAGRALGMQLVIVGSIMQQGSAYAVDVQLVHVGSKRVVKSVQDRVDGDLNDLAASMDFLAAELLGTSEKTVSPRPERRRPLRPQPRPEVPEQEYRGGGGGFKWAYVGLGLLVAGGVGAGVMLAQGGGSGSGNTPTTPSNLLPGPPNLP